MEASEVVRIRTNLRRDYKACTGEPGCKRPVVITYGMCRVHAARRVNHGTTTAQHSLNRRQRRPYVQAAFSWIKARIRKDDTDVLQTLCEFDSFIRTCEPQHISDLSRKHLGSKRKTQGILRGVLKRWPNGHQAAIAILSSVIGVRLACLYEPEITRHPAFTRAMQVSAVLSLLPWGSRHPHLVGRHLAKRLDNALDPFIRYMKNTTQRDREILTRVATRVYDQGVRWETLSSKYIIPNHKRTRRGHPCPWRGKAAPKKGDRYHVHLARQA